MPLTPKAIYKDLMNNELDKTSAVELLITLIENAEYLSTRISGIEILHKMKLKDKKIYHLLENLIISDVNENIKIYSATVLKDLFEEEAIPPLKWAIQNEKSLKCVISFIIRLGELKSNEARLVLVDYITALTRKKYKYNLKSLIEEKCIHRMSNHELAELLVNYKVISSLKLKFGYVKFIQNEEGVIINLDLSNLDYQGMGLNKLNNSIDSILTLSFLKRLDLSNNHIISLPEEINESNSLEYLDLSFNNLNRLPKSISSLSSLKTLNVKSNHLKSLPESIGALSLLQNLLLRDNQIKKLPDSLSRLKSLKTLDLHHNRLQNINIDFRLLVDLIDLELGWNRFKIIPGSLRSFKSLNKLNLGRNQLDEIPFWIEELENLKELFLYDNNLEDLPLSIKNLQYLEELNLRNNRIESIPQGIKSSTSIKNLNLSWNQIKILPDWISKLNSLEILSVKRHQESLILFLYMSIFQRFLPYNQR